MSRGHLHLVLLGPPASGKGTQGRRLAEEFGLSYLSTGALLRSTVAAGGPLVTELKPVLDRGDYVPDETMCRILGPWLGNREGGWVLDGFPRTLGQDDFLKDWLDRSGQAVSAAISLEVPKSELIRRIEDRIECVGCRWSGQKSDAGVGSTCPVCGNPAVARADDSLENFRSRYDEFVRHTLPVIERYKASGGLRECDATRPISEVAAGMSGLVKQLQRDGQETT